MSHVPEELFYRGAIPQFGITFEVANYCDQTLAKKSNMERGYHVKLSRVSKKIIKKEVINYGNF